MRSSQKGDNNPNQETLEIVRTGEEYSNSGVGEAGRKQNNQTPWQELAGDSLEPEHDAAETREFWAYSIAGRCSRSWDAGLRRSGERSPATGSSAQSARWTANGSRR